MPKTYLTATVEDDGRRTVRDAGGNVILSRRHPGLEATLAEAEEMFRPVEAKRDDAGRYTSARTTMSRKNFEAMSARDRYTAMREGKVEVVD